MSDHGLCPTECHIVQAALAHAAKHSTAWSASQIPLASAAWSEGVLRDIVSEIDLTGPIADCDGAEIAAPPTDAGLAQFVEWTQRSFAGTEEENTGEPENALSPHRPTLPIRLAVAAAAPPVPRSPRTPPSSRT